MFTKNTNMILCNPKSLRIKLNKNSQPQQNRHSCNFFFSFIISTRSLIAFFEQLGNIYDAVALLWVYFLDACLGTACGFRSKGP